MLQWKFFKRAFLSVLLLLMMALAPNSTLAAETLEASFWTLDWRAREEQVIQTLERHEFFLADQISDQSDRWLVFDKGRFLGHPAQVKIRWDAGEPRETREIKDIAVGFAARGADTEPVFQKALAVFTERYGEPLNKNTYWLKSYPPIKVEAVKWRAFNAAGDPFAVTLGRVGTEKVIGETPADSRVQITVEREAQQEIGGTKSAWADRFPAPQLIGPGQEGAPGAATVGVMPTLLYSRVGSLSYIYIFDAEPEYQTLDEFLTKRARPVLVARVTDDSFEVPAGVLMPGRTYYWYVESIHAPGSRSEAIKYSPHYYFKS